jgi:hypothetical protein
VRLGQNMTTCLGVCLSHPQEHLASTPGTPTRWRKSLSPIASVRRRVAIVLSGFLRDACNLGTRVSHGVCHAGVCFPPDASRHCLLHSAPRQVSMSLLVFVRSRSSCSSVCLIIERSISSVERRCIHSVDTIWNVAVGRIRYGQSESSFISSMHHIINTSDQARSVVRAGGMRSGITCMRDSIMVSMRRRRRRQAYNICSEMVVEWIAAM